MSMPTQCSKSQSLAIFVVNLTKGAASFPPIIIALVPIQLLLKSRIWDREILRFVDAWVCRQGYLEDNEDGTINIPQPRASGEQAQPA